MVKRGAELDISRAAAYFVRWWREEGGLLAASSDFPLQTERFLKEDDSSTTIDSGDGSHNVTHGWGFDFQWQLSFKELSAATSEDKSSTMEALIQSKMEDCIEQYLIDSEREDRDESNISATQRKKQLSIEEKARRKQKYAKAKR